MPPQPQHPRPSRSPSPTHPAAPPPPQDGYRNQGGFHMIGSGRDKIEKPDQLAAAEKVGVRPRRGGRADLARPALLGACAASPSVQGAGLPHAQRVTHPASAPPSTAISQTCRDHGLDGLVIIGGDDSNTNAAVLAEHFLEQASRRGGLQSVTASASCGLPAFWLAARGRGGCQQAALAAQARVLLSRHGGLSPFFASSTPLLQGLNTRVVGVPKTIDGKPPPQLLAFVWAAIWEGPPARLQAAPGPRAASFPANVSGVPGRRRPSSLPAPPAPPALAACRRPQERRRAHFVWV